MLTRSVVKNDWCDVQHLFKLKPKLHRNCQKMVNIVIERQYKYVKPCSILYPNFPDTYCELELLFDVIESTIK